jgi:hypothetical protein
MKSILRRLKSLASGYRRRVGLGTPSPAQNAKESYYPSEGARFISLTPKRALEDYKLYASESRVLTFQHKNHTAQLSSKLLLRVYSTDEETNLSTEVYARSLHPTELPWLDEDRYFAFGYTILEIHTKVENTANIILSPKWGWTPYTVSHGEL